jgi:hypothetical protein
VSATAIREYLERRFVAHRVAFWHDQEEQYASELDSIDLSGVTTVRVANDEYAIKGQLHGRPEETFVAFRSALVQTLKDGKRISL